MDPDVYGDIAYFDLGDEIEKLKAENKLRDDHIQLLESDIEKLTATITQLKEDQNNLTNNISSLYLTAKTEIDRKDRMIADLRTQVDNACFRRGNFRNRFKRKELEPNTSELNDTKRFKSGDIGKEVKIENMEKNTTEYRADDKSLVQKIPLSTNYSYKCTDKESRSKYKDRINKYEVDRESEELTDEDDTDKRSDRDNKNGKVINNEKRIDQENRCEESGQFSNRENKASDFRDDVSRNAVGEQRPDFRDWRNRRFGDRDGIRGNDSRNEENFSKGRFNTDRRDNEANRRFDDRKIWGNDWRDNKNRDEINREVDQNRERFDDRDRRDDTGIRKYNVWGEDENYSEYTGRETRTDSRDRRDHERNRRYGDRDNWDKDVEHDRNRSRERRPDNRDRWGDQRDRRFYDRGIRDERDTRHNDTYKNEETNFETNRNVRRIPLERSNNGRRETPPLQSRDSRERSMEKSEATQSLQHKSDKNLTSKISPDAVPDIKIEAKISNKDTCVDTEQEGKISRPSLTGNENATKNKPTKKRLKMLHDMEERIKKKRFSMSTSQNEDIKNDSKELLSSFDDEYIILSDINAEDSKSSSDRLSVSSSVKSINKKNVSQGTSGEQSKTFNSRTIHDIKNKSQNSVSVPAIEITQPGDSPVKNSNDAAKDLIKEKESRKQQNSRLQDNTSRKEIKSTQNKSTRSPKKNINLTRSSQKKCTVTEIPMKRNLANSSIKRLCEQKNCSENLSECNQVASSEDMQISNAKRKSSQKKRDSSSDLDKKALSQKSPSVPCSVESNMQNMKLMTKNDKNYEKSKQKLDDTENIIVKPIVVGEREMENKDNFKSKISSEVLRSKEESTQNIALKIDISQDNIDNKSQSKETTNQLPTKVKTEIQKKLEETNTQEEEITRSKSTPKVNDQKDNPKLKNSDQSLSKPNADNKEALGQVEPQTALQRDGNIHIEEKVKENWSIEHEQDSVQSKIRKSPNSTKNVKKDSSSSKKPTEETQEEDSRNNKTNLPQNKSGSATSTKESLKPVKGRSSIESKKNTKIEMETCSNEITESNKIENPSRDQIKEKGSEYDKKDSSAEVKVCKGSTRDSVSEVKKVDKRRSSKNAKEDEPKIKESVKEKIDMNDVNTKKNTMFKEESNKIQKPVQRSTESSKQKRVKKTEEDEENNKIESNNVAHISKEHNKLKLEKKEVILAKKPIIEDNGDKSEIKNSIKKTVEFEKERTETTGICTTNNEDTSKTKIKEDLLEIKDDKQKLQKELVNTTKDKKMVEECRKYQSNKDEKSKEANREKLNSQQLEAKGIPTKEPLLKEGLSSKDVPSNEKSKRVDVKKDEVLEESDKQQKTEVDVNNDKKILHKESTGMIKDHSNVDLGKKQLNENGDKTETLDRPKASGDEKVVECKTDASSRGEIKQIEEEVDKKIISDETKCFTAKKSELKGTEKNEAKNAPVTLSKSSNSWARNARRTVPNLQPNKHPKICNNSPDNVLKSEREHPVTHKPGTSSRDTLELKVIKYAGMGNILQQSVVHTAESIPTEIKPENFKCTKSIMKSEEKVTIIDDTVSKSEMPAKKKTNIIKAAMEGILDSSTSDETTDDPKTDNTELIHKKLDVLIAQCVSETAAASKTGNIQKGTGDIPTGNSDTQSNKSDKPDTKNVPETVTIYSSSKGTSECVQIIYDCSKPKVQTVQNNLVNKKMLNVTPKKIVTRRRITPTPVKGNKPVCSFENILGNSNHSKSFSGSSNSAPAKSSPLHLTHEGEIPILHLEENHITNLPTEGHVNDKNILNLLDTMNISNMECDMTKFKNISTETGPSSRDLNLTISPIKGDNLTFENMIKKVTSTPVNGRTSTKTGETSSETQRNTLGSNSVKAGKIINNSLPLRRRRRCRLIIRD